MTCMRFLVLLAVLPGTAAADHQHGMVTGETKGASSFSAGLSLVAAKYDTMEYGGDYQGVVPAVRWANHRFSASANFGAYRLIKNGLERFGAGDAMAHGQAMLLERGNASTGIALAVSAPTGDQRAGLGMGHPMVMPAAYARWSERAFNLDGSIGYGRAFGSDAASHHDHGSGSLVDPMNLQEMTFTAGGDYALARQLRAGGRLSGAVPIGDGATRLVAGARVLWTEGRVDTAFEIQAGLAGDPFSVRGVLETALRF
jgi:hypothetical protein